MLSRLRNTAPRTLKHQVRWLNLHEYQSLEVFSKFGVAVPKGMVAKTAEEAETIAAKEFAGEDVVVKSQVLAGGRGLGHFKESGLQGGVFIVSEGPAKVKEYASQMIGNTLVTKQTGEAGKPCNTLLLAEKFTISRERYFAILMDRSSGGPVLIGSKVGGTSIEDIAEEDPSAIIKMPVDIIEGLSMEKATEIAVKMDFVGDRIQPAAECIMGLYATFTGCDCTMVEINPLAELTDGRVIACDAKVNFDDNAEYRQKEIHDLRDESQEDAREVAAKKWDLNYIGLDGNIACMVNGAGLAMSTMDLLQLYGGTPANFLDVGGSAKEDQITAAFEILQKDPNVKSILVNIFGGIMKCDVIAAGVVGACRNIGLKKPLVVRLVGTNVEAGSKIIADSEFKETLHSINDLNAAAKKAVELANAA
jgi:succinyl-CoA synthetase beta subunit